MTGQGLEQMCRYKGCRKGWIQCHVGVCGQKLEFFISFNRAQWDVPFTVEFIITVLTWWLLSWKHNFITASSQVPSQPNSYDCGIYHLYFVQTFMSDEKKSANVILVCWAFPVCLSDASQSRPRSLHCPTIPGGFLVVLPGRPGILQELCLS